MQTVNIRHISFDLWKTLITSNPKYKEAQALFVTQYIKSRFGVEINLAEALTSLRNASIHFDRLGIATHKHCFTDKDIMFFSLLPFNLPLQPHHLDALTLESNRIFLTNPPDLINPGEIEQVFAELGKKGIKTSILSNSGSIEGKTLASFIKNTILGSLFNEHFFSDQTKYYKPGIEAFELLKHNSHGSATIHVGDSVECDGGAEKVGIKFIHINSTSGKTIKEVLNHIQQ